MSKEQIGKIVSIALVALVSLLAVFGYDIGVIQPREASGLLPLGAEVGERGMTANVLKLDNLQVRNAIQSNGTLTQVGASTFTGAATFNGGTATTGNVAGTAGVFGGGFGSSGCTLGSAGTLQCDGAATLGSTLDVTGTTTLNGVVTLGDGGDTATINTSDWDISATGDATGFGAITADGTIDAATVEHNGTFQAGYGNEIAVGATRSVAIGDRNVITGTYSQAFGKLNVASGINSFTAGAVNIASGVSSYGFGDGNIVPGADAFGIGASNVITGQGSYGIGSGNHVAGLFAQAVGRDNVASTHGAKVFGVASTASGEASLALGGGNVVSGTYATALGNGNVVSGMAAVGLGMYTLANKTGQLAFGTGSFTGLGNVADGMAQTNVFVPRLAAATHISGTWYSLYLDGASTLMALAADTAWTVRAQVVGLTAGAAQMWNYEVVCGVKNDGGTTSVQGNSVTSIYEADADYDVQCAADDTNDALLIQVRRTDETDYAIRWVATVWATQVGYPAP